MQDNYERLEHGNAGDAYIDSIQNGTSTVTPIVLGAFRVQLNWIRVVDVAGVFESVESKERGHLETYSCSSASCCKAFLATV